MRKIIAALTIGVLAALAGAVAAVTPAQATVCVRCPQPPPDKDCGVSGHLCVIGRVIGPHRTHR